MKDSLDAIVKADSAARQRIELLQKKILEGDMLLEGEKEKLEKEYDNRARAEIAEFQKSQDERVKTLENQLQTTLEQAKKRAEEFLTTKKTKLSRELFSEITKQ